MWRVLYEDGVAYSSTDGPPHDAPGYGVLVIQQDGHDLLFNKDYYLWHSGHGCWLETDLVGLVDYLVIAAPLIDAVKVGRVVPRGAFKDAMRRVNER